ncbi:MAG: IS481 family transposase [Actinomycetota bacterium]
MTKFKIARGYFSNNYQQKDIAKSIKCHKNTVHNIIKQCNKKSPDNEIWQYLNSNTHIEEDKLNKLFSFLRGKSKKPHNCRYGLKEDSEEEILIVDKFNECKYGFKRMFRHLKQQGYNIEDVYTLGNIKGVYKRNRFKSKKIRTANGERRSLYEYDLIAAFEYLQYDVKVIADKHALPADIYEKFKDSKRLPKYQWTIIDAKTRTRFLAWSHTRSSFFGFRFLEYTVCWLRSHGISTKINVQMDMGGEFYSGSKRKQKKWNDHFKHYDVYVYDTEGAKWKQNLVERSHRTDDEEFYCPRGNEINTITEFFSEAQFWLIYFNNRSHSGIGMNGLSPKQKLEKLGIINANQICNFPCLILDDFFEPFHSFFNIKFSDFNLCTKSQNVLTPYLHKK